MIVSRVYPFPANVGKRTVLSGYLAFLLKELPPEAVSYVVLGDELGPEAATGGVDFRRIARPSLPAKLWSVLRRVVFGQQSLQEAMTATSKVGRELARLLEEVDPDLVIADTVRVGRLLDDLGPGLDKKRRWVLYLDDMYSVRYRSMIAAMDRGGDIGDVLGVFRADVPGPLRKLLGNRAILRALLTLEAGRIDRSTADLSQTFDEAILLNESEVSLLESMAPAANVRLLPPYRSATGRAARRTWAGEPRFVILGNLGYAPNEAGLRSFIEEALPAIRASMPEARISVVGAGGTPEFLRFLRSVGAPMDVVGYVDDLSTVLSGAAALLAPVTMGSGIKIKILDALAYSLPVITTPDGIVGTRLRHGVHVILEQDIGRFGEAMKQLMDPAANARMSQAVAEIHDRVYSGDATHRAYRESLFGSSDDDAEQAEDGRHACR